MLQLLLGKLTNLFFLVFYRGLLDGDVFFKTLYFKFLFFNSFLSRLLQGRKLLVKVLDLFLVI